MPNPPRLYRTVREYLARPGQSVVLGTAASAVQVVYAGDDGGGRPVLIESLEHAVPHRYRLTDRYLAPNHGCTWKPERLGNGLTIWRLIQGDPARVPAAPRDYLAPGPASVKVPT